jgi:hypothetical protein
MLRKYTLLLLLFSMVTYCQAQDKGYIGLSVGPSFPMGDYGSSSINNEHAGLAETGLMIDLSFGYKLGKNFGIAALVRGQSNPIDEDAFDIFSLYGLSYTIQADAWSLGNYMVGGYLSVPVTEGKISFDSRVLVGVANATSPELTITISDGYSTEWVRQNSESGTSFAFLLGAGFKFNVGPKICLLTNIDYSSTDAEMDVTSTSSQGDVETGKIEQTMATFNISVGFGIRL